MKVLGPGDLVVHRTGNAIPLWDAPEPREGTAVRGCVRYSREELGVVLETRPIARGIGVKVLTAAGLVGWAESTLLHECP